MAYTTRYGEVNRMLQIAMDVAHEGFYTSGQAINDMAIRYAAMKQALVSISMHCPSLDVTGIRELCEEGLTGEYNVGASLHARHEADDRLIPAVPDLVRAIEGALDAFSWHENAGKFQPSGSNGLTVVQELRAALAKAGVL